MLTDKQTCAELVILARLAGRTDADEQETCKCLASIVTFCKGRAQSLAKNDVQVALQALSTTILSALQKNFVVPFEILPILLELMTSGYTQNIILPGVCPRALEEVSKHFLSKSITPVGYSATDVLLQLAEAQHSMPNAFLKATVLQKLYSLILFQGVQACDDNLKSVVELIASTLGSLQAAPDSTRFPVQIYAICCLSPLSDAPSAFPKLPFEFVSNLLSAATSVTDYISREGFGHGKPWHFSSLEQPSLKVEESHVLIFFGTLPRLLKIAATAGPLATDEEGNTLLHRLSTTHLSTCLAAFLCSSGPELDLQVRNQAGQTALDLAVAGSHGACADILRQYGSGSLCCDRESPKDVREERSEKNVHLGLSQGRASSMPLLPLGAEADGHVASLSWTGPHMVASSGPQAEQAPAMRKMSLFDSARQAPQPSQQDLEERRRIVQLALAKLETGVDEGGGEPPSPLSAPGYLRNPTGSLPVHSNPFASFQEPQEEAAPLGSLASKQVDIPGMRLPSLSVMRTSSQGSIGLGASYSPSRHSHDFQSFSLDSRMAAAPRLLDWEEELRAQSAARNGEWTGSAPPSTRMWLGNIAAHVTVRSLYEVFGVFGQLTDAAVFPARIGPLGYAFANFLRVEDAARAYEALNNTSVPALTGSKLLKIRYKPSQHAKIAGDALECPVPQPSSHLWLGNVLTRPNKAAIEELFSQFGPVTSVRVFPGKTFAFVNYDSLQNAAAAMQHLDGQAWASISGPKPMVVRYQAGPVLPQILQDATAAKQFSLPPPALLHGSAGLLPPGDLAAMAPLTQPPVSRHSSLPVLDAHSRSSLAPPAPGQDPESILPAVNLSNRLNPNNMHFDASLAETYKNMSKAEKESLWSRDRTQQQLLAMQMEQVPTDLSMLGLPQPQANLLAGHLARQPARDPWAASLAPPLPGFSQQLRVPDLLQGGLQASRLQLGDGGQLPASQPGLDPARSSACSLPHSLQAQLQHLLATASPSLAYH